MDKKINSRNSLGEEFLIYLLEGCWRELCNEGRRYLNDKTKVRETLRTRAISFKPQFRASYDHIIDSLADRFIAEMSPFLDEVRFPLLSEIVDLPADKIINEIYEANKEYWDSAF